MVKSPILVLQSRLISFYARWGGPSRFTRLGAHETTSFCSTLAGPSISFSKEFALKHKKVVSLCGGDHLVLQTKRMISKTFDGR